MNNWMISILGLVGAGCLTGVTVNSFLSRFSLPTSVLPYEPRTLPKFKPEQRPLAALALVAIVLMSFGQVLWGLLFLLIGVGVWYFSKNGSRLIEGHQRSKNLVQMRELFPQALGMFIQALKTGQTVPQVLEYLSNELPQPLRQEFSLVCMEMNLGLSAEEALSKMNEKYPDFSEFGRFLESYKISRQTGANLTHLLQVLLNGMEEKNRLLRKMNAMTSQAKLSGLVMGLLPFLLGLVFFVMDPSLMVPLVTTPGGWGILCAAAVLESIGFLWIRQLLRLEI